jgi:HD-like signal output (HDOD) protein
LSRYKNTVLENCLHSACDIGIPLLKARFPTYLETLSIANRVAARRSLGVEEERHGINHAFVGALLAEKWTLSSDVVLAIGRHHEPEVLHEAPVPPVTRALVALNYIVEKAIQEHRGEAASLEWIEGGSAATEVLGLSPSAADEMCAALKDQFRRPNSALSFRS